MKKTSSKKSPFGTVILLQPVVSVSGLGGVGVGVGVGSALFLQAERKRNADKKRELVINVRVRIIVFFYEYTEYGNSAYGTGRNNDLISLSNIVLLTPAIQKARNSRPSITVQFMASVSS
ncbi:MAG: hypothetical protein U0X40_10840 [Ferruginibacter sp.]